MIINDNLSYSLSRQLTLQTNDVILKNISLNSFALIPKDIKKSERKGCIEHTVSFPESLKFLWNIGN